MASFSARLPRNSYLTSKLDFYHYRNLNFHPDFLSGVELGKDHVRAVTVRDFDTLASYVPAWDRVAGKAPQGVATLLPGFVDAFLRHRLKPSESWFCSFAYAGDELVGALPVIVAPHPILGRRWPVLRTPYDDHTRSGDIVLAPKHAEAALRALLTEVGRQVTGHLCLHLHAVRQKSPVWLALQNELDSYLVCRGQCSMYAYLDVQGDFNRYFAGLGKMRQNLRRGRRKLEKRGTVSVEMRRGSAAGEDFLTEFMALEASGWKGRMGTAILSDPNLVTFYTRLVRNFAARGQLEWHALRVDDRLVAAQLAIRCGGSLMLPKYAYDEDFAEGIPGHVLVAEVIREAFSRPELTEVNTMSYANQHQLFRMNCDEYVDLHLVRQAALPVLFQFPRIAMSLYRKHVRPRIPEAINQAYRTLRRRDIRRPQGDQRPQQPQ